MAQLVALMSGVVLSGVAEVVGSNLAQNIYSIYRLVESLYPSIEAKYLQHLSAQLIH